MYDFVFNDLGMPEDRLLKPCPFCGGEAKVKAMGTNRRSMVIGCTECSCDLETGETWVDENIRWNRRVLNEL